ncbi:MAG: 3-phosphoshikimate 1-carboxyvinyltransferase [Lachnospiraceae bacterium]|nr:3-phosphoshikimate 1-carboxyvinyltransferase [Lachnospiraceae bacterium]
MVRTDGNVIALNVPGSKSITNRALLIAALAKGESVLKGVLFSDDSRHFLDCLNELGFLTEIDENSRSVKINGLSGKLPKKEASLNVGSAGTAARFITAFLGLSKGGAYHLDSSEQMKKRPMKELLDSLTELGCDISYDGNEGHFPYTIRGKGFLKPETTVNIDKSSQFLSALLISSVLSKEDFTVHTTGAHGMAYIDMTLRMMWEFSVDVMRMGNDYVISRGQKYTAREYEIEPDMSAAAYFYAAGALTGANVRVDGVHFDSMQGDIEFLRILEKMGCELKDTDEGIVLTPPVSGKLKGVDADMSAFSDQALTLAAIAPYADSPVIIRNIGHIRLQECDRLNAMEKNLTALGIQCETDADSIKIYPGVPKGCEIETYEDHRVAMSFALTGLLVPGVEIINPSCCKKTFEDYFDVFDEFTQKVSELRKRNE